MSDQEQTGERFFDAFLDDYFAECEEHLAGVRRVLLALEASAGGGPDNGAALNELFRLFHSLKGISAMVELRPAETLAHELESYLRALRQGDRTVSAEGMDALFQGTQRLEAVIAAHKFKRPQPALDDLLERVTRLLGGQPRPAEPPSVDRETDAADRRQRWLCRFVPTRELLARGFGVDSVRKQLVAIGTIVKATPYVGGEGDIRFDFEVLTEHGSDAFDGLRQNGLSVEPMPGSDAAESAPPVWEEPPPSDVPPSSVAAHVVRVDLKRLDDLMRTVGDLVISRARLAESLGRIEPEVAPAAWRPVQENLGAIDGQLRTLRESIMRVRLVPVGEIFRRMPFVVRDLARESGKRVHLDLRGQGTEIDKFIIERMMDPVLHLVRNAVGHGIETPDERIAQGKLPDATVTLAAAAVGELVRIDIADDGRGIDVPRVLERARAMGLPLPTGTPDSAGLLSLMCAPGFSTSEQTDRISGRGVGMNVVKAAVEALSGSLSLETTPGAGSRFTIQLPLTLAIADALIARVGDETFAVPQVAVREVIEVNADDVRVLENQEIVPYRGTALPLLRLSRVFSMAHRGGGRFHVFVIAAPNATGIVVDRIVGQREIVVRRIADPLVKSEGISGATDLGDGRVVLILDPTALTRLVRPGAADRAREKYA